MACSKSLKYTLWCIIAIGLSSCGLLAPEWVGPLKERGIKQPVKEAYHMEDDNFIYCTLIDTNAVYISENEWVFTNRQGEIVQGETEVYDFIRFSVNGTAFMSSYIDHKPMEKEVNSLNNGQHCFYTVEDDVVKIEFYNHDRKHFQYWYGKIRNDGSIYFYKYRGRPWGTARGKLEYLYKKEPITITRPLEFPE